MQQNIPLVEAASPCKWIIADKSERAEPFRTRTIIAEENGKKVVYKCADSEKAKAFVKEMVAKERANATYVGGHFEVHCGVLQGDRIKYEYLPYPSLEDQMRIPMREGNFQAAQGLLAKYVHKIQALKSTLVVPREFLKMVGDKDWYTCETKCLCPGLLDLTPKNILLNGNRWILLDNEWSFDFPVPVVFIFFRGIRELAIALQAEIRQTTTQDTPALGLFARGSRTYYIPLIWTKFIVTANIGLRRLTAWEAGFRQYTMGTKAYVGRIKTRPSLRTHFPAWLMPSENRIPIKMKKFAKSLPGVAKLVHILDQ